MTTTKGLVYLLVGLLSLPAINCYADPDIALLPAVGEATAVTQEHNERVRASMSETTDNRAAAQRGLVAQASETAILNSDGSLAWDLSAFSFLSEEAPSTVNPSLWRQSQLNTLHGLYEVTDGIWQVRGYDLAVMTVIRGESGWIVVDPLTTPATAAAGLTLVNEHLGSLPVAAVLYTHSHADHFGGVRGVLTEEEIEAGEIPIVAPHGFTEAAVKENLLVGNAMIRRSQFQFGTLLPPGPAQHVGTGLGQRLSIGEVGLVHANREINPEGESLSLDGILFEFVDAAGTEAPAEFVFYLPQFKALCGTEVVSHTFHNLLTPRGAKARDALRWSQVIDSMLMTYGEQAEVLFGSHHWPTWGGDAIRGLLKNQRDRYRHVHDQTLRLANQGLTMHEIAEALDQPVFIQDDFSVRDYYGTLNHNVKAVYQYYFGWWDGVPANYHPHPPKPLSERYVEAMGGPDTALNQGITAFQEGDYRWAAQVFNHLVFSDETDEAAKRWLAASYEQMGFQAESGAWRNYYLTAASELRHGLPKTPTVSTGNRAFYAAVDTLDLFDALAVRFDPSRYPHASANLHFTFPDRGDEISLDITEAVSFPRQGHQGEADVTVRLNRSDLDRLLLGEVTVNDLMADQSLTLDGDPLLFFGYLQALDRFDPWFNVVTP